jgi:putative transposase
VKTIQAYRFALDLTSGQERVVFAHAGAARVAHNWVLARVKAVMDQRTAERSYGVLDEQLTESVSWSLAGLRKVWNQAKAEVAPWWTEVSKEAFNTGLDALARGLKNWADSRTGKRAGRPVGFPRFKSRRRSAPSVRFTTGAIRVEPDRMHVVLPRLGRLKLHESARKLARRLDNGTARIMSATVRRDGGRWHVSFTVEVERADRHPARPDSVVGLDVGIKHLAVLSTGELVDNPRHLAAARSRLRALGRVLSRRQGPDRRTGRRPSKRWERASARLGRVYARVANLRRDGLHKLTTRLAREHGTVVVEDLNVAGMLANRRLAWHIADVGFAEIRRHLAYKTLWYGGRLLVADRWYPSSKTCSGCGAVKAKLALSEREYACEACGLVIDRDRNASLNLAALAAEFDTAGSGPLGSDRASSKELIVGSMVSSSPFTTRAGWVTLARPAGDVPRSHLASALSWAPIDSSDTGVSRSSGEAVDHRGVPVVQHGRQVVQADERDIAFGAHLPIREGDPVDVNRRGRNIPVAHCHASSLSVVVSPAEAILRGAARVLKRDGFNGIGVDGLAASAEVTSGGFYSNFATKEALLEEARETYERRMTELVATLAPAMKGTPEERTQHAWTAVATMVGAVTVARALPPGDNARAVLDAARTAVVRMVVDGLNSR